MVLCEKGRLRISYMICERMNCENRLFDMQRRSRVAIHTTILMCLIDD